MAYPTKDEAGNPILSRFAYGKEAGGDEHIILVDADGKPIISGLSSVTNMNLEKWGATALTGRDVTTDLKVLTDLKKGAQNADAVALETANVLKALGLPMLFNGATLDRQRNNEEIVLLASAVRSASLWSPFQTNYNHQGVVIFFDITAVPGGDTVSLETRIRHDNLSSDTGMAASPAYSTTGCRVFYYGPGVVNAVGSHSGNYRLPRQWRIYIAHSGAGEFTYSAGACYV